MSKLILTLMLSIVLIGMIGLVTAEVETLGTFKQGTCVNLVQTCANCTYLNVTGVLYPNSTNAISTQDMTKVGTTYNYTFCGTGTLGDYIVNGIGDPGGELSIWSYDFLVTTTGSSSGNTLPLFLLLGGAVLFIIALWNKNLFVSIFSGFVFTIAGIYMMIFGLGLFLDMYTRTIAFISLGLGLIIILITSLEMLE